MASVTLYPTVAQNYVGGNPGSSADWTNPGNAVADDGAVATTPTLSSFNSKWLDCRTFNFSLPLGAVITGIQVEFEAKTTTGTALGEIQVIKAGVRTGTAKGVTTIGTTNTVYTYGSSSDLWGTTWTPGQVNATDFGIAVYLYASSGGAVQGELDFLRVTIHYDLVSPQTANPGTGQIYPGTNPGDVVWNNPENARLDDGTYSTVTVSSGPGVFLSKTLDLRNFGFNIPSGDLIFGVVVEVNWFTNNSAASEMKDIQLLKGGVLSGTGKGTSVIPASEGTTTFGSSSDLWGNTLTPADVNSADFGVAFYVGMKNSGGATISVDSVVIKVYYGLRFTGSAVLRKSVLLRSTSTSTVPTRTGTARLSLRKTLVNQATSTKPTFSGTAKLSKTVILKALAVLPPIFRGTASLSKNVVLVDRGVVSVPSFSGTARLRRSVNLFTEGTYEDPPPHYGGVLYKLVGLRSSGTVQPPVYYGSSVLSKPISFRNVSVALPPKFTGTARLSKRIQVSMFGGATQFSFASLNMFIRGKEPTLLSSSLNLYVAGSDLASLTPMVVGDLPLFIDSAYLANASLNLFVEGYSVLQTIQSGLNLFLSADYPIATKSLDLYLMADLGSVSRSLPLFIKGAGLNVGYYFVRSGLNLVIEGTGTGVVPIEVEGSLDLFIKGVINPTYGVNQSLPLFIKVLDGNLIDNSLDLFIEGTNPNLITSNLNLVIPNTLLRGSLPLFIRGI